MANNFTNAHIVCTSSLTTVYTCPGGTTAVILLAQVANVTNRADTITLLWTDSSNGNAVTHLCSQTPVAAQQSIGCLTGKLVLSAGDTLKAQCATFQALEITTSALEMS